MAALIAFCSAMTGLLCFCTGWASRYAMMTADRHQPRPEPPADRRPPPADRRPPPPASYANRQSAADIKLTTQYLKQRS